MKTHQHISSSPAINFQLATLLFILLAAFWTGGCSEQDKEQQVHTSENTREMTIPVEGMSCNSCVANVKSNLKPMEGVEQVAVSLENRNATISYNPDKISPEQVRKAINELGYKAGESVSKD